MTNRPSVYGTENTAVSRGYRLMLASELGDRHDKYTPIPATHLQSVRPSHATRTFVPAAGPTSGPDEPRPACETADPEIFFQDNNTSWGRKVSKEAKAICWACPLRQRCLVHADEYGIWGGKTMAERRS